MTTITFGGQPLGVGGEIRRAVDIARASHIDGVSRLRPATSPAATLGDRPLPSLWRAFPLSRVVEWGEVERGEVSLWDRLYMFLYFTKKTNSRV